MQIEDNLIPISISKACRLGVEVMVVISGKRWQPKRFCGRPFHSRGWSPLAASHDARAALIGPPQVYLLTGTPITNRPRDLFNLLRCVGHPSARSFLSFAKRYCDAYKNDYGWVTTGASNLDRFLTPDGKPCRGAETCAVAHYD